MTQPLLSVPGPTFEDILVHQMAEAHWKLRRIGRYEAELLAHYPNPFLDDEAARKLAQLTRYEASARRAFHKAFEDLRRHRADQQAANQRAHRALSSALDAAMERLLGAAAEPASAGGDSNPISTQPSCGQQPPPTDGSRAAATRPEPPHQKGNHLPINGEPG